LNVGKIKDEKFEGTKG